MLKFKKVAYNSAELAEFNKLYEVSFPAAERVPFNVLIKKVKRGKGQFLGLYEDDQIVGMMYYVEFAELVYLFYFAIDSRMQSHGYGKEALDFFTNQFRHKKIALLIEELDEQAENIAQRYRRLHFYERQGFHQTGEYVTEFGETYEMMSFGDGRPIKKHYAALMQYFWSLPMYYLLEGYDKVLLWRNKQTDN